MRRKTLLRFVLAAVLALGLLPSAAVAKGPVHTTASRSGWGIPSGSFWDFVLQLLGPAPHLKNSWGIDPDGLTVAPPPSQIDNRGTIDPDGLKNRSQIDPDGSAIAPAPTQSDNHGTIDPNG